jgi:hypothetical protein
VIAVAEHTARQLAASGRRTPAGRLMAPKMDPGLQSRQITKPRVTEITMCGDGILGHEELPTWGLREDWQTAVRSGATKLKFEEWKEKQK